MAAGIEVRHGKHCAKKIGKRCNCAPSYRADLGRVALPPNVSRKRTFKTERQAIAWRRDTLTVAAKTAQVRAPTNAARTLRAASDEWLELARSGVIRNRSGDPYKPSVLRSYEAALRNRLLPDFGPMQLSELRRLDVQDFADRILAEGRDASTVRNVLMPLRVIFKRALERDEVAVNPTVGLRLPAVRGRRDRVAEPDEMRRLLAALEPRDAAIFATAFYGGLRLGELQAVAWHDVDLAADVPTIRVRHSWDAKEGLGLPKSRSSVRTVPIAAELRSMLREHRLALGRSSGFVFGRSQSRPFNPPSLYRRAQIAWARTCASCTQHLDKHDGDGCGFRPLQAIGLHECRHSFVSLWHDAGVSLDRIGDYAGHKASGITNRYRHLSDPRRAADVTLVDAYLRQSLVEHEEAIAR